MDPSTLPEDIYKILDESNDHEVSEANVEWAGECFKTLLRTRLKKKEQKVGEDTLRFSALGKRDRQIWYAANKPEVAEPLSGQTHLKFMYGDVVEVLLLFLAKEAGHEVTHEQHEVEADGVKGHMDAIIDGIPTDVKSASPFSFDKFNNGTLIFQDSFGYIPQLSGYANEVNKTDRAGFFVADKVNGRLCWSEIDKLIIEGNLPRPRIAHLKQVIASPNPPNKCYEDVPEGKSGNRKLAVECSYCPFKFHCWKDANRGQGLKTYKYAKGPIFLTQVKKEPNVEKLSSV